MSGVAQAYQGGPISAEPRINDRIRVPEVRLVGPNGEQVGIVAIGDALRLAQEADLDLVEVAPMARPPVCKLMDYGKFKYESAQKAREARKNQAHTVIKEMKLRPKIDPHDYETKKGHVVRFLKQGDKVKITIMFRGREQSRPELGFRLLQRLADDVEELGFVESAPKQDGRNMIMVLGPHEEEGRGPRRARRRQGPPRGGGRAQVVEAETPRPERPMPRPRPLLPRRSSPKRQRPSPRRRPGRRRAGGRGAPQRPTDRHLDDPGSAAPPAPTGQPPDGRTDEETPAPCRRSRRTAGPRSASG